MGQFFTEFIMGLQNNPSANASLAAYSSNALCNLIEFSEQRFLRDEFNAAGSIGALVSNYGNNPSMLAAAAAAHHQLSQQSLQLNQQINQQNLQQQLQHHHLQQQFQQHFLQNVSPGLTAAAANLQAQHLLNSSTANGLQVNSSPGSNCSSPDAISQLSGTIKSEDHSNHSYLSESALREGALVNSSLDKSRILNPIELALNASVQKHLASQKTSLSKSELKFSVKSILSEESAAENGVHGSPGSRSSSVNSKQPVTSLEALIKSEKPNAENDSSVVTKKEPLDSPSNRCPVKGESNAFSRSSSSSPPPQNPHFVQQQQPNHHELKVNQQQSVKTTERRTATEKGKQI